MFSRLFGRKPKKKLAYEFDDEEFDDDFDDEEFDDDFDDEEFDDEKFDDEEFDEDDYYDDVEAELNRIVDLIDEWLERFQETHYFAALSRDEKEEADFVVSAFAEYMYTYEDVAPEEWDESSVTICCLSTLPRKISADEQFFRAVAPVLSAFFQFAAAEELLPQGRSLAKAVEKLDEEIVRRSKDPRNWGMAKSFVMGAFDSGVNIEDADELNAYLSQQAARELAAVTGESDDVDDRPALPLDPEPYEPREPYERESPKVGRNDPCPCGSGRKYKHCCGRRG